jgi:hypothetical protein
MDDLGSRFINDLLGRITGPMQFRLVLQPVMGTIFAIRDGLKDARLGRPPYFWSMFWDPNSRKELLEEGWKAVFRIIVLGVVMDAVYQYIEIKGVRPAELLVVVFVLACLPYLLIRGPVNRIARAFRKNSPPPVRR